MKCLSLWQPWATLLVSGHKRIETRGWPTRHRGSLLIHAAKKWDGTLAEMCLASPFRDALAGFGVPGARHDWTTADVEARKAGWGMPFGCIVGRVNVNGCYRSEDVRFAEAEADYCPIGSGSMWGMGFQAPETERPFGDYSPGRFAFVCSNPVVFVKPIPYRGMQGLFDVPEELEAR